MNNTAGGLLGAPIAETVMGAQAAEAGGRPIRVCYVTSPREIETEGVGSNPNITPTLSYLDRAIKESPYLNRLNLQLAAVFIDDDGKEQGRQLQESGSAAYNYLCEFCSEKGIPLGMELSRKWRWIPKKDAASREAGKMEYERRMLSFMRRNSIDLILSDSYVVLFNSVMLDAKTGYDGLIINIHPGIASEVPGLFPTRDALSRANFFTQSEAERERVRKNLGNGKIDIAPEGEHLDSMVNVLGRMNMEYEFHGQSASISKNGAPIFRAATGATLHFVNDEIDRGRPIHVSTGTPIREGATVKELREDNYLTKNMVVAMGMRKLMKSEKLGFAPLMGRNRVKNDAFNARMLAMVR